MRILMFTRSFSKFPSWEKGKHGPNTHGLHQEKGSCLFPLWTFPTIAPWLVRAKIFSPKSTCKRPKITNSVEQISQIYVRRNPNTGGPYRKNVLVELAGPCRIKGTGEHGGQINVIFYTKRFQLAPDPPFQVGPDPTSPTSQPSPQSLLIERLLSPSIAHSILNTCNLHHLLAADVGLLTPFPSSARYAFTSHFCLLFLHTSSTHLHITCLVSMRVRFVEGMVILAHACWKLDLQEYRIL